MTEFKDPSRPSLECQDQSSSPVALNCPTSTRIASTPSSLTTISSLALSSPVVIKLVMSSRMIFSISILLWLPLSAVVPSLRLCPRVSTLSPNAWQSSRLQAARDKRSLCLISGLCVSQDLSLRSSLQLTL